MIKAEASSPFNPPPDHKMYKFNSLFYLGLHYDALGQSFESKQCMKMALKTFADKISGNSQDITFLLPVIHMTIRDWYDDDDDFYEDASSGAFGDLTAERGSNVSDDLERVHCLRERFRNMKAVDLKRELKRLNLKVSGSKKELQDRLIDAYLTSDAA